VVPVPLLLLPPQPEEIISTKRTITNPMNHRTLSFTSSILLFDFFRQVICHKNPQFRILVIPAVSYAMEFSFFTSLRIFTNATIPKINFALPVFRRWAFFSHGLYFWRIV
jgi:hypothetical protein